VGVGDGRALRSVAMVLRTLGNIQGGMLENVVRTHKGGRERKVFKSDESFIEVRRAWGGGGPRK